MIKEDGEKNRRGAKRLEHASVVRETQYLATDKALRQHPKPPSNNPGDWIHKDGVKNPIQMLPLVDTIAFPHHHQDLTDSTSHGEEASHVRPKKKRIRVIHVKGKYDHPPLQKNSNVGGGWTRGEECFD
ncbi:hypothetical protein CDAR_386121 [Caerostris darwini]|uniref:Prolactin receptor n=1 Tax=Caerostris darwini TaxID=1538125 RepID=A0AAV4SIT8_9ARAC|nr:hypothetical protein CDAR_386121 [Caerostris darwini]